MGMENGWKTNNYKPDLVKYFTSGDFLPDKRKGIL